MPYRPIPTTTKERSSPHPHDRLVDEEQIAGPSSSHISSSGGTATESVAGAVVFGARAGASAAAAGDTGIGRSSKGTGAGARGRKSQEQYYELSEMSHSSPMEDDDAYERSGAGMQAAQEQERGLMDDEEEARLTTNSTDEFGRHHGPSHPWNDHAQAVASSSTLVTKGQRFLGLNLADAAVVRHLTINAMLIGMWYFFSLSISLYNQWMFSGKHLNFKFPLFTTCMHMLVQFFLASAILFFFPRFRPQSSTSTSTSRPSSSSHSASTSATEYRSWAVFGTMTLVFYVTRIGPCGAATGLDIGLGNTSMRFITLTFYTMCKSSVLGFVLLFAFLFRLERPSVKLLTIIAVMTTGVVLMVAGETAFHLGGFFLIMTSSAFSGFRWALTQILLLRNPATSNPFSSLFYLAPVMFVTLLIIAVAAEGVGKVIVGLNELAAAQGAFRSALLLLFPGILAFCMTASEFALLKRTSVVTLSVCGIFKEVVTILAAQNTLDQDRMTPVNLAGLAITISSIATYNYLKIKKMRADAESELEKSQMARNTEGDDSPVGGEQERFIVSDVHDEAGVKEDDEDEEERPMLSHVGGDETEDGRGLNSKSRRARRSS